MPRVHIASQGTHLFQPPVPMFTIYAPGYGHANRKKCRVTFTDGISEEHDTGYEGCPLHEGVMKQREVANGTHRIQSVTNISDVVLEIQVA